MSNQDMRQMIQASLLGVGRFTRHAKIQQAEHEAQRELACHPRFGDSRYMLHVEHNCQVQTEDGEDAEPILAIIVTAPNIRAARRKATETFPGHIRRFLHWQPYPLYPTDAAVA